MALDFSAGKDVFTVPNPTGTVTDFTLLVRLTRARNGDLFDACTEQNALKIRVSKGDGITELAFDPFYEDWTASAEEIIFACLWSGSLTNSGSYELWVTPALSTNTAYGVSDTYGQYNAYPASVAGVWPMSSDGNDRTGNLNHLTGVGGLTFGGASGNIGYSTQNSSGQFAYTADVLDITSEFALLGLFNVTSDAGDSAYFGAATGGVTQQNHQTFYDNNGSSDRLAIYNGSTIQYGGTIITANAWHHIAERYNGSQISGYLDGVNQANITGAYPYNTYSLSIGGAGGTKYLIGFEQFVTAIIGDPGADYIAYDSSQKLDNSTFWGTPTWVSGSGGTSVSGSDSFVFSDSASVSIGLSISGSESLVLSDSANSAILLTLTASDSAVFSDTGSANISIVITGLDSIGLGDIGSSGGLLPITASDVLYLSDTASVQISVDVSGSDSMGVGDFGTGGDIAIGTGSDTLVLSDAASVNLSVSVSGSDAISLSDIESILHDLVLSGSDSVPFSDIAQSSGVISGILRLAIRALGKSQTVVTAQESHTIVTVRKV